MHNVQLTLSLSSLFKLTPSLPILISVLLEIIFNGHELEQSGFCSSYCPVCSRYLLELMSSLLHWTLADWTLADWTLARSYGHYRADWPLGRKNWSSHIQKPWPPLEGKAKKISYN